MNELNILNNSNAEQFSFETFSYKSDEFEAEWNVELAGYVIIFNDGKIAQTQIDIEQNKLHADYNETYLERYTEYDDELSQEQDDLVDEFVYQINKLQSQKIWGTQQDD